LTDTNVLVWRMRTNKVCFLASIMVELTKPFTISDLCMFADKCLHVNKA